jgi:nitroimidazol reductase NimA-like FMN-containing flavoprotein (pyridoxamine 5'-phosphate oxidase superfamily)
MFRPMRRMKQLLPEAGTTAMLESCTSGVLAVHGDDDYPYAVPLSFAYEDGKLFFHSAVAGHKLDALKRNDKASFCVIAADDIVPEKFTTHFQSAIAFGSAKVVTDDAEKRHALMLLAEKYSPEYLASAGSEIDGDWKRVSVIELAIEHMTGKASLELVKDRTEKPGDVSRESVLPRP